VFSGLAANNASIACYIGKTGSSNRMPICCSTLQIAISVKRKKERRKDENILIKKYRYNRWIGIPYQYIRNFNITRATFSSSIPPPPQNSHSSKLKLLPNTCFEILPFSHVLLLYVYIKI